MSSTTLNNTGPVGNLTAWSVQHNVGARITNPPEAASLYCIALLVLTAAQLSGQQPDLRGIWKAPPAINENIESVSGKLPYVPSALTKKQANRPDADPENRCFQPGIPRANYSSPFQIFQTSDAVYIVYQDAHSYRVIPLDGRTHEDGIPLAMGDSRGRWEGNTLVVDVISLTGETWLDKAGNYHSDAAHVVERYTRKDPSTLLYEATVEDPKVFQKPVKISMTMQLDSKGQILEDECVEDAKGLRHHVSPFKK